MTTPIAFRNVKVIQNPRERYDVWARLFVVEHRKQVVGWPGGHFFSGSPQELIQFALRFLQVLGLQVEQGHPSQPMMRPYDERGSPRLAPKVPPGFGVANWSDCPTKAMIIGCVLQLRPGACQHEVNGLGFKHGWISAAIQCGHEPDQVYGRTHPTAVGILAFQVKPAVRPRNLRGSLRKYGPGGILPMPLVVPHFIIQPFFQPCAPTRIRAMPMGFSTCSRTNSSYSWPLAASIILPSVIAEICIGISGSRIKVQRLSQHETDYI